MIAKMSIQETWFAAINDASPRSGGNGPRTRTRTPTIARSERDHPRARRRRACGEERG
ncbi:MAG TPA: hypothetical protein VF038_11810 [Usitatibacter sp.]